jgi:hypothetical protein
VDKSKPESQRISRREFTRGSILTVAAAVPLALAKTASGQAPAQEPALSTDSQAEVDVKVAAVLRKYDKLLSNAEKLDVRRLLTEGQKPLETMRLFPLDNADQPANVLKLFPDVPSARPTTAKPRNSDKG